MTGVTALLWGCADTQQDADAVNKRTSCIHWSLGKVKFKVKYLISNTLEFCFYFYVFLTNLCDLSESSCVELR